MSGKDSEGSSEAVALGTEPLVLDQWFVISSLNIMGFPLSSGKDKKAAVDMALGQLGASKKREPLACAIQSHTRGAWGDLQEEWTPLFNQCPLGGGGRAAGGVGWLINPTHRRKVKRTISERADGEGANIMWVTVLLPTGQEVDMASVYIPPAGTHDGKSMEVIRGEVHKAMRDKHSRGEAMIVMGDINCDMTRGGEEACAWQGVLDSVAMTDLTLEGGWQLRATRFPLGRQAETMRPSHIDMVAVSQSILGVTQARVMSIGSGTELDSGDRPKTDHKLISMRLKLSRKPLVPPRPDKKIFMVNEAAKKEHIKAEVEDHLRRTGMWGDAVQALASSSRAPKDIEEAQVAMVAALTYTAEQVVGFKILPGEKRQKAHTWKVVKAFRAKERARKHLAKLKRDKATEPRIEQATKARAEARNAFKKVLKAQVKSMVDDTLQAAKEEGSGEWSKQAQALGNRLSSNKRGEQEVADFGTMSYPAGVTKVATGPKAVGALASEFFHTVSKYDPLCEEFDSEFEGRVSRAVRHMETNHMAFGATQSDKDTPSTAEVRTAIKDAATKLHKSAGTDGVCNWMLVWGGETAVKGLQLLFEAAWKAKHLPASWRQGMVKFLHKNKSKSAQEISNFRPICLISVIGKVFTKAWLPRLVKKLVPNLPLEQGCGRKGQGSSEHLWAFMAMVEDVIDGKDGQNTKEAFAMFADLHKCYDQVWRDGLFLALYVQGVRGPMLEMVKAWLEGAEAQTSWREPPMIKQEQGLRQGCVLRPILFCAFANTFLLKGPTKAVPQEMELVVKEFLGQGLQRLEGTDHGINCPALARRSMTTLFMDDTTLMSPTRGGLEAELEVYLNFCRKMRMRLNTDKSKIMHFTKKGDAQNQAMTIAAGGRTFTTPKVGDGGTMTHKHLGFHLDQKLTGTSHLHRMRGMARGKEETLEVLGRQSEELAVLSLETRVGPSFCNNMELVKNLHTDPVASKMRAGFVQGVRAAMGIKKKVCHTGANLGLQPLLTETEVVPWDIQVQTQAVRLAGKLRQGEVQAPSNKLAGELGKALADAKLHTTGRTRENSFLQGALPHARKWGTPFAQPVGKLAKEEWKRCLREAAKEDVEKAGRESLQIRGADPEDGGRQSNTKFVQLVNRSNIGREARRMRELIPSRTLRVGMKNLKLGALQHARGSQAKTQPGRASL